MNATGVQDQKTACLTPASGHKNSSLERLKNVSRVDISVDDLAGFALEHYELGRRLGTGGMGVVYLAKHRHLGKSFAVKFIRNDLHSEEAVTRFLGEIATLGCLQHPNLINAVDAGVEQHLPYCVTELLNGHDLGRWISMRGLMPIAAAAEVLSQALAGIAFAHDHGIIHRDLKPSNLFLQYDGSVKVLDFGLSLSESNEDAATQAGQLLGTIDFMSPEQIQNSHAANESSDIYALAATMLYLVCGQAPYPSTKYPSSINKLHAIGRKVPEGLEPEATTVPKPLKVLLLRCLDAEPRNRPKSAAEFRQQLQQYASPTALAAWMKKEQGTSIGFALIANKYSDVQPKADRPKDRPPTRFISSIRALSAVALLFVAIAGSAMLYKSKTHSPTVSEAKQRTASRAATLQPSAEVTVHTRHNMPSSQIDIETSVPARQTISAQPPRINANAIGISFDSSPRHRPSSDRARARAFNPNQTDPARINHHNAP
jgi:serine/threonine protein kinase